MPEPGTEPIIFQGGSWDGEYTDVSKGVRSAERWTRTEDGTGRVPGSVDIYVRSANHVEFLPKGKKRMKKSTVFKFAGTLTRAGDAAKLRKTDKEK